MSQITCPYCDNGEIYCDDPIGQDETIELECAKCDKPYLVTADYSVSYICEAPEDAAADEDRYHELRKKMNAP